MNGTEVWLYGSSARGDRDRLSDVDLLVVGDGDVDPTTLELPARERVSISRYSWAEIEDMAGYGSLFLHHLKLEGHPLLETEGGRLRSLLVSLGPYARVERELACFSAVLDDVEVALAGDHSVPFELSVVATAARHAAILGCYQMGTPDFGRTSAFRRLLPQLGYSEVFVEEAIWLYSFRRADDESQVIDAGATSGDVRLWVGRIRQIIGQVEAMVR